MDRFNQFETSARSLDRASVRCMKPFGGLHSRAPVTAFERNVPSSIRLVRARPCDTVPTRSADEQASDRLSEIWTIVLKGSAADDAFVSALRREAINGFTLYRAASCPSQILARSGLEWMSSRIQVTTGSHSACSQAFSAAALRTASCFWSQTPASVVLARAGSNGSQNPCSRARFTKPIRPSTKRWADDREAIRLAHLSPGNGGKAFESQPQRATSRWRAFARVCQPVRSSRNAARDQPGATSTSRTFAADPERIADLFEMDGQLLHNDWPWIAALW